MRYLCGTKYEVSVVVPCCNEELNVRPLYERLKNVLQQCVSSFEIIFVDDGSQDNTFGAISQVCSEDPRVKLVQFRRNFGQTAALAAGFDCATGTAIIAIDGDLQYDPEDIPRLLGKLAEGYDIASGWRSNRKKDGFITRRLPSLVANRLMAAVSRVRLHDFGSTFKAYHCDVLKEIRLYGEMHRFVPALASAVGARIAEVPVDLNPREHGKSKYGLSRAWRVLLDIISVKFLISYSKQPLRLFGMIGLIFGGIGTAIMFSLALMKLLFGEPFGWHIPLLLFSVMLALIGMQFLSLGLIAELISRTYHESQDKPIYTVRQSIGFEEEERKKCRLPD